MKPVFTAVLVLVAACSSPTPAPMPQTSAAVESSDEAPAGGTAAVKTLVAHETNVELGEKPLTVTVPLGNAAPRALAVARDASRHLVLRVEGISVTNQPGVVYDVHLAGVPREVGVLSFYGTEESNGQGIAGFPIDAAVLQTLREDSRELRVIFTPRGVTDENGRETIRLTGRARFSRLRLIEE